MFQICSIRDTEKFLTGKKTRVLLSIKNFLSMLVLHPRSNVGFLRDVAQFLIRRDIKNLFNDIDNCTIEIVFYI